MSRAWGVADGRARLPIGAMMPVASLVYPDEFVIRLTSGGKFAAGFGAFRPKATIALAVVYLAILSIACDPGVAPEEACVRDDRVLKLGFYAYFAPVSHSADGEPGSSGFDVHQGYEADLLTALEAMDGVGVRTPAGRGGRVRGRGDNGRRRGDPASRGDGRLLEGRLHP